MAFNKSIGIDLGTANTLVFMKGKGVIMREPSVVAVDTKNDTVKYVGVEAKEVIGKTPGSISVVRPLKDGVIADFDVTAAMLRIFIKRACGSSLLFKPTVIICIPSGVTEVERRAVRDASTNAGAGTVMIIEEPMAAAIGAGLPIQEATGSMVVDIGGGTSDVAVISLNERTAENIKIEIGTAYKLDEELTLEVKGRNLINGLPKNAVISSEDIREALSESLDKIVEAIKETLERTPPELAADIIDRGITLTGGGALLRGMDKLVSSETGIDVHIAETPLDCVANGTGYVLDHMDVLKDVLEENNKTL